MQGACEAYGFLECKHLVRDLIDCDNDRTDNSLLVMKYEEEYLYAYIVEVDLEWSVYPSAYEEICRNCGHKYAKVSRTSHIETV